MTFLISSLNKFLQGKNALINYFKKVAYNVHSIRNINYFFIII